jgi:hypothetical protein
MDNDAQPIFEALNLRDHFIARENLERVTGLIASQLQSPDLDELPDGLVFNAGI